MAVGESCPYCKGKMKKGFISGGSSVFFSQTDKISFQNIPRKGEITLKNNSEIVKAYKCETCRKIIFDYNELEYYCTNIFLLFAEEE